MEDGSEQARVNAAMEDNMIAHMSYFHSVSPGMRVDRQPDLTIIDSGLPCNTFNQVCRARLAPATASGRIASALDYFRQVGRPFSWWVGPCDQPGNLPDLLQAAGLQGAESEAAMAMELRLLPPSMTAPAGLRVERVTTAKQLEDYCSIVSALWDPPDLQVTTFYRTVRDAVLSPDSPIRFYVGYLGAEPISTSELCLAGGVAGLYGVATKESARHRGYGSALTMRPLYDAREAGFTTATLQASEMGQPVYARIGFRVTGRFTEFQ